MEVWSQTQGNGETPMVVYKHTTMDRSHDESLRLHVSSYLVACLASHDDIEHNDKLSRRELQASTSEEFIVS